MNTHNRLPLRMPVNPGLDLEREYGYDVVENHPRRDQDQLRGLAGGGFETQLSPHSIPGGVGVTLADGPPRRGKRLAHSLAGPALPAGRARSADGAHLRICHAFVTPVCYAGIG